MDDGSLLNLRVWCNGIVCRTIKCKHIKMGVEALGLAARRAAPRASTAILANVTALGSEVGWWFH